MTEQESDSRDASKISIGKWRLALHAAMLTVAGVAIQPTIAPSAMADTILVTNYQFVPDSTITWSDGNQDIISGTFTANYTYDDQGQLKFISFIPAQITLTGPGVEAGLYYGDIGPSDLTDFMSGDESLQYAFIQFYFDSELTGEPASLSDGTYFQIGYPFGTFRATAVSVQGGVDPVPEPSTITLLGGALVLTGLRRRGTRNGPV
jgi:hypothetical protein